MPRSPNPFYVLDLASDCTRAEVERAGQKLLAMLELDLQGARVCATPDGPRGRDAAGVREAMAELRDPQRRLFHELWAQPRPWPLAGAGQVGELGDVPGLDGASGFEAALAALGWR